MKFTLFILLLFSLSPISSQLSEVLNLCKLESKPLRDTTMIYIVGSDNCYYCRRAVYDICEKFSDKKKIKISFVSTESSISTNTFRDYMLQNGVYMRFADEECVEMIHKKIIPIVYIRSKKKNKKLRGWKTKWVNRINKIYAG